ncbi:Inner membrane protein YghB [Vibrio thalassae]|uniref:Inner membrane protein YghB n=1 Tax=Vibrio thalassae TaxID=1243014 RepID=A0A240EHA1_9VIBR|nr:DedA family protein [Vibrio thalassae]SNX48044.1 Inner membrane protein YghB [Vibrio thalassae]
MQHINDLLLAMKPLLEQYGYLALVVSIFLEGIGIPMPGQSLLIAASLLSSPEFMNLTLVLTLSWLSCFFGNTCGYLIGYYFEEWLNKKGYISGPKMQKLQSMVKHYGPTCLVISRFVEGMKQFMPLACGVAKMPRHQFLLGNTLATTIWVAVFGVLTHFAFDHLQLFQQFYHHHKTVVWSISAVLFVALIVALLRRKRHAPKQQ